MTEGNEADQAPEKQFILEEDGFEVNARDFARDNLPEGLSEIFIGHTQTPKVIGPDSPIPTSRFLYLRYDPKRAYAFGASVIEKRDAFIEAHKADGYALFPAPGSSYIVAAKTKPQQIPS